MVFFHANKFNSWQMPNASEGIWPNVNCSVICPRDMMGKGKASRLGSLARYDE